CGLVDTSLGPIARIPLSPFLARGPFRVGARGLVPPEFVEQRFWIAGYDKQVAMCLANEACGGGGIDEGEKWGEVASDVEEGAGFLVLAELGAADGFEEFFECAEAAGQGDEGVGEGVETCDALGERGDLVEFGKAGMRDLARKDHRGHDTDDATT